ncbi:amidohydrolase [Alkalibacterium putridalgicola]|uniref:Amidohydrolase n=1 Tax=Alkalibacterium putridalgicola TaxID=426703 RepID=A0A1H7QYB6_9LACT|nr:amidohydrolase [Alkalibacterium putridalgicola]GEK88998.1 putative amidohydrolase YhaA [Alkalibacterium putridalgicola]SEL52976.1 amidohydrolase [Alkalibacterium putridalgicola]
MSINTIEEELKECFPYTVQWRRHLHENPEPSFEEWDTRKYIVEKLRSFGYTEIEENVGGGGIVTYLRGKNLGSTIAFRADFDALRIEEETGLPFASKNEGVMHACGHDGHTATLLSVAKVMKAHEDELSGSVKFIFQHAEEVLPGGGKSMVEAGVLDDVDAVYGLHLRSPLEFGTVSYCSGYAMAAADFFDITIQGKGGHAAYPSATVDSVVVASYVVNQLQSIISRNKDPKKAGVLTVSTLKAGDGAHNVIADKAVIKGTVRTFDPELRNLIEEKISTMTRHICDAHGAACEVNYTRGYPALFNHEKETALIKSLFESNRKELKIDSTPMRMGGEDFAYFLQEKPGSFFFVHSGNREKGIIYPHHHPKFDFDERAMLVGGQCFMDIIGHYLMIGEGSETEEAYKAAVVD